MHKFKSCIRTCLDLYIHPLIIEFFWSTNLQFQIEEKKINTKAVVDASRGRDFGNHSACRWASDFPGEDCWIRRNYLLLSHCAISWIKNKTHHNWFLINCGRKIKKSPLLEFWIIFRQSFMTKWFMTERIHSNIYSTSCANTYHDLMEWFILQRKWIS